MFRVIVRFRGRLGCVDRIGFERRNEGRVNSRDLSSGWSLVTFRRRGGVEGTVWGIIVEGRVTRFTGCLLEHRCVGSCLSIQFYRQLAIQAQLGLLVGSYEELSERTRGVVQLGVFC